MTSFGRVPPEIHHQEILRLHSLSDQNGCNQSPSKEGTENEFEDYKEEQTVNSMVPIWRKIKAN